MTNQLGPRDRKSGDRHAPPAGEQLSESAQRAKWIDSPDDQEDHAGQTLATREHEVIKHWAEERRAKPATTPGGDTDSPHVLRLDFPGYDDRLEEISWDAWLETFDQRELVFLFQQHLKSGQQSNFFILDNPHRERG